MKLGIFVWDTGIDYGQGRIPQNDALGVMNPVIFKVHNGLESQPYSLDEVRNLADNVYRSQSIDFHAWGVAHGTNIDIAREEGRLAGRFAAVTNREYVLDLEDDKRYYWQGIRGTAHAFCEGYTETSNGIQLRICPDARGTHANGINLLEWINEPIVNVWHPQLYSAAFGEHIANWVQSGAIEPLVNNGVSKERIYPVLAAWRETTGELSLDPDIVEAELRYLKDSGFPGAALWRRGVVSNEQVARLQSIEVWPAPQPPPVPEPTGSKIRLGEINITQISDTEFELTQRLKIV